MDFQNRALDMMLAGADEIASAFKLCFAVSTGAVVLFTHILAATQLPTVLRVVVAASVLCFGYSSIHCIHSILGIGRIKLGAAKVLVKDMEKRGDEFLKDSSDAITQLTTSAKTMESLFRAGVFFAAVFVIGYVFAHFSK